tara:strand:- start:708 stop:1730 length:1023 start_codon:yes stop_codon:yes gene_type:complete
MSNQNKILSLRKMPRVGAAAIVAAAGRSDISAVTNLVSETNNVVQQTQVQANIIDKLQFYNQSFQLASTQEQIIYDQKGLDYASNLPFINKRDAAGNLIINGTVQEVTDEEAAQYNEMVIVEANDRLYTNRSVNKAINTQFKYFKFPPTIISRQTDIGEIDVQLPENELDVFSARYTPDFVIQWFTMAPSYKIDDGPYGFQKLKYNNILRGPQQSDPGTYMITPELIESGKNLRMSYAVDVHNAFASGSLNSNRDPAAVGFSTRLQRRSADYQPDLTNAGVADYKVVPPTGWDTLSGEHTVLNSEMRPWDKWYIEGVCGTRTNGRYVADGCYWEIEAVDP